MFAIAFVVADAEAHHPRGARAAYGDIASTLRKFEFARIQGSVDVTESNDMANLLCGCPRFEGAAVVSTRGARHSRIQDRELERFHTARQKG